MNKLFVYCFVVLAIMGYGCGGKKVSFDWKEPLDIAVNQKTNILWKWSGASDNEHELWVKMSFGNHKTIYYVASGSKNPEVQGNRYRGKDGRLRFMPSVVISCLPFDGQRWVEISRNVGMDYLNHCGATLRNVKITGIEVSLNSDGELSVDDIAIRRL